MMKYLYLVCALALLNACGGKKDKKEAAQKAALTRTVQQGPQKMAEDNVELNVKFAGKDYISLVTLTPDESLPLVVNDAEEQYVDNKIYLRLTSKTGDLVYEKTFTKQDFASLVDADFLKKSRLEGIAYSESTKESFVYVVTLCYPQQPDMTVPISITIDGKTKQMVAAKIEPKIEFEQFTEEIQYTGGWE